MLSPQLRRKVFNLWSMFWSSGISNPLTAIEQITYLLFLKHLELLDARRVAQGKGSIYAIEWLGDKKQDSEGKVISPENYEQCRWSYIRQAGNYELMNEVVFPWLRVLDQILLKTGNNANNVLESGMMEDAYFQLPREKAATLQSAIKDIHNLFTLDTHSDLMGDIFEELLRGIQSAGKNGQFRTPRHIIRFMVELVQPTPQDRVIDPAAGTGGYLFSSIQYLRKQAMLEQHLHENLRLEWDGTPHRLAVDERNLLHAEQFTGYDNDRTMVRIGWMNMILHGIDSPRIERRDSLGKGLSDKESERYTVVLANPPFTGSVDIEDLHDRRFRQGGKKTFTNKSELLFLALFLDLLEPGGRAAVIVPEGVLFGSTNAHRALRRRLLFEHDLKAVISLPAGAFHPYAGVKTSILYFHKHRRNDDPKFAPGEEPYTQNVLFYEILDDGFSLDAKRNELYQPGDLPDALDKIKNSSTSTDYVRPRIHTERWRLVDLSTVDLYDYLIGDLDHDYGIHELFPEFKQFINTEGEIDFEALTNAVVAAQTLRIAEAYATNLRTAATAHKDLDKRLRQIRKAFTDAAREHLDHQDEQHGRKAFDAALESAHKQVESNLDTSGNKPAAADANHTDDDLKDVAKAIVKEFAKLDGYTIYLRSLNAYPVPPEEHPYRRADGHLEARSWIVPVRVLARNPEWSGADGTLQGSHDEQGIVRSEYLAWLKSENKYNDDGSLPELELLEPTCIEANDFNLSAGRYKPFALETSDYGNPQDLITQLQQRERNILTSLEQLLAMVEGRE